MNDTSTPTAQSIIAVENLTAGYPGHVILRDINFTIAAGEIVVIIGGSGSGKSTILKHMIGLNPPLNGKILIKGHDIARAEGAERLQILRNIGVAYQSGALFGSMTLSENVRLPLEEFTDLPRDAIDEIAKLKLGLVGLEKAIGRYPNEISGGMQKRAAIARALALDPEIIFLDEPSAGLDPITSAGLDELILHLAHDLGMTCVLVSHELASIYTIADRVIMVSAKARTMIAEGKPEDLRDHSEDAYVRQFFNREATPVTQGAAA